MPEHIWSVLCYKGCLDQYTNQVSLLDVVEGVTIRTIGAPPRKAKNVAMPFNLNIVSMWLPADRSIPEKIQVRVVVIAPDGTEISPGGYLEGDLTSRPRLRTFMRFSAVPYHGGGTYRFAVEYRGSEGDQWRRVASLPMDLEIGEPLPDATPARTKKRKASMRN